MNDTTSLTASRTPSHEEITKKARELWESYGQPHGRDEEIWLEAERLLQAPETPSPSPLPPATAAAPATPTPLPARRPAGAATATPRSARGKSVAK
ncbi:MAG TPA: DUF2934 domain-containing protein [Opitutus sp.]|nr:DUF2934 domain-containing protein [Opitutus sp.]